MRDTQSIPDTIPDTSSVLSGLCPRGQAPQRLLSHLHGFSTARRGVGPPKAHGVARCWKAPGPPGADPRRYLPRFAENAIWDGIVARLGRKCPIWHARGMGRRFGAQQRGSSRRSCRACRMGQFWRPAGEKVSYMACSRLLLGGGHANALPRGRVRGRASGKGWAKTRQRLRREAKNSLSWGPATWIMITTMRMTPLMVSWMRESILRAMMILSMTS